MRSPHVAEDRGFTLVELMVVVAIIGILVTIAVVTYYFAGERSKRVACLDNQRSLSNAETMYRSAHDGAAPASLDDLRSYVIWSSSRFGKCTVGDTALNFDPATGAISCPTPGHTP